MVEDRRKVAPKVEIRPVGLDERADWEPLWKGYQTFYKVVIPDETTAVVWGRLHDDAEPMHLLGAYVDGRLCGIVHYLFHRSCWTIGDYCYLQDLFVDPGVRRGGVGRALIEHVYEEARRAASPRVYWLTHESNAAAMRLYDRVADRSGFIQYRKVLPGL
jgi:GNAT superfamily N-acetyltransferase